MHAIPFFYPSFKMKGPYYDSKIKSKNNDKKNNSKKVGVVGVRPPYINHLEVAKESDLATLESSVNGRTTKKKCWFCL